MPDVTMTSRPMATDYFTGSPSPVRDISYGITGTKGSTTYFYWVVANYTWGSVPPIAPLIVANAPNVLGVTGSVVLSWIQPSSQVVNYTVLRSTTNQFPGNSTTAVIVNTTNTTVTDSGAALVPATFTAIPAMRGVIYIDGTGPVPVLVSNIGMQVAGALSVGGSVSSSGSEFTATGFNTTGNTGSVDAFRSYTITLVGTNWQVVAPDGTVTIVPTAAVQAQRIPLGPVPANTYFTFAGVTVTAGPVGGTPAAHIGNIGTTLNPGSVAFFNVDLHSVPNFSDTSTTIGRNDLGALTLEIEVNVGATNTVNQLTPPCSFVVSIAWGVLF